MNCVAEDPVLENFLYAGLHRGVFISVDRGKRWNLLGSNMAPTVISDLVIQERELDLLAGTMGRGIYKMNLRPVHEAYRNGEPATGMLFPVPPLQAPWQNDTHRDVNEQSVKRTEITWWQPAAGPVKLELVQGMKKIWEWQGEGRRGLNQYRWNGVTEETERKEAYFFQYRTYIKPGAYTLRISGSGTDGRQEFTVTESVKYE